MLKLRDRDESISDLEISFPILFSEHLPRRLRACESRELRLLPQRLRDHPLFSLPSLQAEI